MRISTRSSDRSPVFFFFWLCRNPQYITFNALWDFGKCCLRPRRCGIPYIAITGWKPGPASGKHYAIRTAAPLLRAEVIIVDPPPVSCMNECAARSISCIPVSLMAYRVGPNELIPAPAAPAARIASEETGHFPGLEGEFDFFKTKLLDGIDRCAKLIEILFRDPGKHPHQDLVAERLHLIKRDRAAGPEDLGFPRSARPFRESPGSQAGCASQRENRDA